MRRGFTLEQLRKTLDDYTDYKPLSFFRKNSIEINQLRALFGKLYYAGYSEFGYEWEDEHDGWDRDLGYWRDSNCYTEMVQTLSGEEQLEAGERQILNRFDRGHYTHHTHGVLESFIRVVREAVEYADNERREAMSTVNLSHSIVSPTWGLIDSASSLLTRMGRCFGQGNASSSVDVNALYSRIKRICDELGLVADICPITTDVVQHRTEINSCHHVFERQAIQEWHTVSASEDGEAACPCCRDKFTFDQIVDKPLGFQDLLTRLAQWASEQATVDNTEASTQSARALFMTS